MKMYPHKTAMARSQASPLARMLYKSGLLTGKSVLDYGAGRGKDYEYYISKELEAYAYDPWAAFGFSELIVQHYDVITCFYVLNVLSTKSERLAALLAIKVLMHQDSVLYLAVRSEREIERFAKRRAWVQYNDGYISSLTKKTFQKGFSAAELAQLTLEAGFNEVEVNERLNKSSTIMLALKINTV
jgi:hypothetical protein